MGITPLAFTGISRYSQDFGTIVKRQVEIASLPLRNLQNQQKDAVQRKLLVTNLSSAAERVRAAVERLGELGRTKALTATSSNSAKVTATNVAATSATSYTISEITSIARAAGETTAAGLANSNGAPVSASGSVRLTIGTESFNLDLTGRNTLEGLRNAINQAAGGKVTASILNTGNGATPFYLSLSANSPGATTLTLRDGTTDTDPNLLTSSNQGANTEFRLNGVPVSKKSTFINDVVPGVTFNILGTTTGSETAVVSLSSDRAKLKTALNEFVEAYNAAENQVSGQIGPTAGLLSGDALVRDVQEALRTVTNYRGNGALKSLAELGIEFDRSGAASLNTETFDSLSSGRVQEAFTFFGSETAGFGALANRLKSITDPVTGSARLQQDRYTETDKRLTGEIAELTERITILQTSLSARLQAADALLAQLDSQQGLVTASLDSLKLTVFGKNGG